MEESQSKFARALAARNAEKAEEAARKAGGGNFGGYAELPWSALAPEVEKVVRLLGGPCIEGREPTDAKKIYTAMILGDDDKKFRVLAPSPKENKDWILHKIVSLVTSYDWDADSVGPDGRKGVRIYRYAKSNPDLFNRVTKNNQVENAYESGWKFAESVIWNIIDRGAMDWHKDQKQCRLLSRKASTPDKNGKIWFDYGVPTLVYNLIVDDILSMDGNTDWNDYDVVIKKVSDDPWYKVYHGIDDAKRISEEAKRLIITGPLTEEELSWKRWNLDELFATTSYKRIKSHLGIFIQQVDKVFGKHFYEELSEKVEVEEKEKALKQKEENTAYAMGTAVPEAAPTPVAPEPTPAPKAPEPTVTTNSYNASPIAEAPKTRPSFAPVQQPKVPYVNPLSKMTEEKWKGLMDGTLTGRVYEGVKLMTPEEKALVLDVNMENGTFVWDERAGELYEGAESGFPSPACVHVDPFNGTVFPAEMVSPIPELK